MDETSGAESSKGGDNMDMAMMAQFFKHAMGFQGIPVSCLPKFRGPPLAAGDMSFIEWLEEFEGIIDLYDLTNKEKARALVNHLAGAAKEEVACLEESHRTNYNKVVEVLKLCFGSYETVQTLSSQFHNRNQLESETLSDFSRALKRIYSKMEMAAQTEEESTALKQLRDKSLREQFVRGAAEVWVRRELRRIDLSTSEKSFDEMRKEALTLFQESEAMPRRTKVREVVIEAASLQPHHQVTHETTTTSLLETQRALAEEVKQLKDEMAALRTSMTSMTSVMSRPRSRTGHPNYPNFQCYACQKVGHIARNCPEQHQGNERPPQQTQQVTSGSNNQGN